MFPAPFQNPFSGRLKLPPRWMLPTNGQICKPRQAAVCQCALMPPERRPRSFNKHGEMVNHRLSFYHIWRLQQPPSRVGPRKKFRGAVIGGDWLLCPVIDRSLALAVQAAPVVDTLQKSAQPSRITETVLQLPPVPAVRVAGTELPRNLQRPGLSFGTSAAGTFSPFNVPRRSVGRLGEMAEKRRSPCALSVKAHAFSVEALIGAEKRRKTAGEDAASPDDGTDVSELTESPALRADGACASDRGSECASVGSRKLKP